VFKGTPAQLAEALRQFAAAKADAGKAPPTPLNKPQTPKPAPAAPIIDMEALAADIARMKNRSLDTYRVTIKAKPDDRERD
jgi:hypothetical protein